jgi:2-keto-4-pentenoate hydratase
VAAELLDAERFRRPVAEVTARYSQLSLDDAYAIQRRNIHARQVSGARIVGHKVGLTSAAMRAQMGVSEPDSGVLLDDMAVANGAVLTTHGLLVPRLETEIAFLLGSDLDGTTCDADSARAAVSALCLAVEVIDSRFGAWAMTVIDSIADNASSARFVVSDPAPVYPGWDVRETRVCLDVGGVERTWGLGRAVMGDPVHALTWLARRLARGGRHLRAGDLVLAGSVHASIPLHPGMDIHATAAHLPSVRLQTR